MSESFHEDPSRFLIPPNSIIVIKKPKQAKTTTYLDEAASFIKLNYKCPKGTYDEGFSCGPTKEEKGIDNEPPKFKLETSNTLKTFKKIFKESIEKNQALTTTNPKTGEDNLLKSLVKEVHFDEPPKISPAKEVSKIVEEGGIELFRGVTEPEFTEQFKHGDYYAGKGMYGSGTYCGIGKEKGIPIATSYTSNKDNCVIRMVLDKDAKIIPIKEVKKQIRNMQKSMPPSQNDIDNKLINIITDNPGRWAAMNGYDAISVKDRDYMVVLNRSKLTIQQEPITKEQYPIIKNLAKAISDKKIVQNQINEITQSSQYKNLPSDKQQESLQEYNNRSEKIDKELISLKKELKW